MHDDNGCLADSGLTGKWQLNWQGAKQQRGVGWMENNKSRLGGKSRGGCHFVLGEIKKPDKL